MDAAAKMDFVRFALHAMALHTYPFLASILSVEKDGSAARHVGTAFRISAEGQPLLVTSAHVAEAVRADGRRLAVSAVRGGAPFELRGGPYRVDQELDVAVYEVPPEYPTQGLQFWPIEKADERDELLDTDLLVIHGFPALHDRSEPTGGAVTLRSLPYAVMLRTDELPPELLTSQFAVDYDAANLEGLDHRFVEGVDPSTLAGSPVWRIGASGRAAEEWSPELSVLSGVLTQWRPDSKILVGAKWSCVCAKVGLK